MPVGRVSLNGCEPDAQNMASIASTRGLSAETLLTASATRNAVLGELGALAGKLKSGDLLVVSYSGHGGQIPDQNGDEDDGLDETWCLYDGELLDDELHQAWSKFQSGVRILALSDSCHSGTVLKMIRPDYDPQDQAEPLKLARAQVLKNTLDAVVSQKRSLPSRGRPGGDEQGYGLEGQGRARYLSRARAMPKAKEVAGRRGQGRHRIRRRPGSFLADIDGDVSNRIDSSTTTWEDGFPARRTFRFEPSPFSFPVARTSRRPWISARTGSSPDVEAGLGRRAFNGDHMDFHPTSRQGACVQPNQSPFFYTIGAGMTPLFNRNHTPSR